MSGAESLVGTCAYPNSRLDSANVATVLQRRVVRDLVKRHGINVVRQPTPVSPKMHSLIWGVGVPVITGPLNGGIDGPTRQT